MVRKKKTQPSGAGESSQSQGAGNGTGRGRGAQSSTTVGAQQPAQQGGPSTAGVQQPAQQGGPSTVGAQQPAQQGGRGGYGYQGGRGLAPQSQQGAQQPAQQGGPSTVGAQQPAQQGGRGGYGYQGGRGLAPQSQQGAQQPAQQGGPSTVGAQQPAQQGGPSTVGAQQPAQQGGPSTVGAQQPAQQGGRGGYGYQGGRGLAPQSQQGRGRGYVDRGGDPQGQGRGIYQQPQPQGRMVSQQYGSPQTPYQGQRSQPQGMPFQQPNRPMLEGGEHQDGGSTTSGRGGGLSSGGPSRPSPVLHQATVAPYQPTVAVDGSSSLNASSSKSVELSPSILVSQVQQLSLQTEGTSTENILPVAPSSKSLRYPLRPGKGTIGAKCIVKANHFIMELPDKDLCQYDVSITPEVTSRGVNRAVMKKLVDLYKESHLGKRLPAYDGQKSLYTAGPLPFNSKAFQITLVDENDGPSVSRRERQFKVVIKLAGRPNLHHLGLFLQGKQSDAPQQAVQVLDIVLRELPTSRYCPVGRSFYSPDLGRRQSLGEGLESWRGFYQSIRPTQMGLSLNIDMSTTAFIEPLPVIEFVIQLLNLNHNALSRALSDTDRVKIKKALRGLKVEVTHRGNMRRKYRISGLTSQTTGELTFAVDEKGTVKSVVQYFKETYGFIIQHPWWPSLQVGNPQRPNYLPMEVCKIVEGQRYSKRLSESQITALLKVTCQRPRDREKTIVDTVRHNAYGNDPYAEEFGIKISDRLASVEARILPPPRLKYHDTGVQKDCLPEVGQWNMLNKKMVNGGTVNNWMCIDFSRNEEEAVARGFCNDLAQTCRALGMTFNPEPVLSPYSARPNQVEKVLKARYHDCMTKLQPQRKELDLLIVILQDKKGFLYGDLKRICETELGVVSQCVLLKNVYKNNNPMNQYMVNVALKINVKAGGRNTVLVDALSRRIPLVSDRPTIIFGADVTHPRPGDDCSTSIAAVVASQDWPEVTKYAGLVSAQARDEMIKDLQGMVVDLFKSFRRATGRRPERVIFYRDGVSEGQFYQVLLEELDAVRKACASLEPNYQPPVTFVVVQKRHHTRLFANNHADRYAVDRSGNILPGTVVDSKICHPTEFDFYLCSHAGIQGTSRPAHYHVLWDENNFTADGLQSLTNNLCYTYARCTRSVSIVPPAYYAHLAAFRARCYVESQTSDSGSMTSAEGRGGGSGRNTRFQDANAAVRPLPTLKDNIKKVMFYC